MKLKQKKGFTIVELVIVIAVIAILAAILIPTFTNLIQKANLSSDQVAVRNMNNALAMDEAQNGKPEDLLTAMLRMKENGYDFDSYKPLTDGYRFFWNQEKNKVVLAKEEVGEDQKTAFKVVYPTDMANEVVDASYKALYRDTIVTREAVNGVKELIAAARNGNKIVSIKDGFDLAAVAAIVNGDYDNPDDLDDITIELKGTIELSNQVWIPIGEAGTTPFSGTLTGGESGATISGLSSAGYTADVANATKLASGQIGVSYGLIGFAENATVENITLTDVNIDLASSGKEMGAIVGYASGDFTMKGCKVYGQIKGLTKVGGLVGVADTWIGEDATRIYKNNGGDHFREYSVHFENCTNNATVIATTTGTNGRAGGILGCALLSNNKKNTNLFKDCTNAGGVQSSMFAGGIVSQKYQGSADDVTVVFENCQNTGTLTSSQTSSNCDHTKISDGKDYCGDFVAYWQQGGTIQLKNCINVAGFDENSTILGKVHSTSPKYFLKIINDDEETLSYGLQGLADSESNAGIISATAFIADLSKLEENAISQTDLNSTENKGYWRKLSN